MNGRKIFTNTALSGLLGILSCAMQDIGKIEKDSEIFNKGIIQAESFYPGGRFNSDDRYTTILKLLPERLPFNDGATFNFGEEARVLDLLYNVGDTVSIKKIDKNYTILNPL